MTAQTPPRLAFYHSRPKMIFLAAGSALFVAAAPWVVSVGMQTGGTDLAIALGAALVDVGFFGSGLLWAVDELLRRRPALELSEEGLIERSSAFSVGFIAWEEIAGTVKSYSDMHPVLGLRLRSPDAFIGRQRPITRFWMRQNSRFAAGPVSIVVSGVGIGLDDLDALIKQRLTCW